jgi:F5/8 type C domain/Bacterial alpha-L-rhamnosidase 6 hairpin glycosidase domain
MTPTVGRERRSRRAGLPALAAVGLALAVWGASRPVHSADPASVRVLDAFKDLTPWTAVGSDGVRAWIHPAAGVGGGALRLDFDLGGTAGFALARRALPLDVPPHFEIAFYLRADAPVNNFQIKLVDASGDNVWWVNRPDVSFPREWQLVRIKQRHIEFAWGPTRDRTLRQTASIEFVVAAGRDGGRGSVYVSQLVLRELPDPPAVVAPPLVQASSSIPGAEAPLALDGAVATAWRSDPAAGPVQALTIDFQQPREFGGLTVRWLAHAHATRYDVQFSDDGVRWQTVRRVLHGRGGPDALFLPESETRFLRLALHDGPARAYGLAELEIRDLAFGASPNAFFQALARDSPRGTYPRGMSGEQTAWTLVGVDGGDESGLLSEDGALEVAKGGFSIEPFVVAGSRVVGWADVEASQFLLDRYLPIPGVTWRRDQWELRVSAFGSGSRGRSRLVARYEIRNLTDQTLGLDLVLAVRPFQVNPPAQFLNTVGGASAIRRIRWDGATLSVDADRKVFPLRPPDRVGTFAFDAGAVPSLLGTADWAGATEVDDEFGYASAALGYRLTLAPRASATVGIAIPLSGPAVRPDLEGRAPGSWLQREQAAVASGWRARLNRVSVEVPAVGQPLIAALRTALAHVLLTRDGPVLRPGTRSYARSWIRDGAMIAESLLRLGHGDVAADYLRWYAPHQFASGKVPCCVDARGADPVPEHDSAGELIFLADEIYRYTGDRRLLEQMWPHVAAAAGYLEGLRQTERTDANLTPATRAFYGLLPASISHEGYSAKPMHSYWDDFWALKGYNGAIEVARVLGRLDAARRLEAQRDEFRADLAASLRHATAAHGIDYLPGSAELGDFDPTSSTIAIAPAGEPHRLPADLVRATFERYWREFVDRRDGRTAWEDYTPYEIRTVGTFVRLGWRDRAHELLAFFMAGRRPVAWNQWPEVVGRDPRQPRFVGDLPHGWVASDFIRAVLDLFVYEREGDQALVLAGGIPPAWLAGSGVTVRDMRTPYGLVRYSLKNEGGGLVLQVAGGTRVPPGGFVLVWPGRQPPPRDARVNGKPARWDGTELRFHELPARIVVHGKP